MTGSNKLRFVTLEGTPRQRGRAHGESLRSEIREVLERTKESWLHESPEEKDPIDHLRQLVQSTELAAAAERWAPDLLEEVRGISEGAGVDFETILAWQFGEELGWLSDYEKTLGASQGSGNHCSVLGVFGEGDRPALMAQTADSWVGFDGLQTVLKIKYPDSPLEAFVFGYPGWIGAYGLNNQGIGLCINSMSARMNYAPDGLGALFVARGILAQPTLDDAERFVRNVKHATGDAYTISGPGRVVSYECSANAVNQFVPYEGATRVYHTNHPLVNGDVRLTEEAIEMLPADQKEEVRKALLNTETRFSTLERRLGDTAQPVTVEAIKSILSSHDPPENPICNHKRPDWRYMTIAGLIMVESTPPEFHVAPGPPCMTAFQTFKF